MDTEQNIKSGYTPPRPLHEMKEAEVVALNDEWFDRVAANRVHVERDALLNTAFMLDQHYVDISRVGNSVRLTPLPKKRGTVRTVEQIIEPAVRSEMARLLRTKPRGVVVPQGQDPEDYEAARAADDVHEFIYQTHEIEEHLEEAVLWSIMGGTGHLAVNYDPLRIDENGNQGDFIFRSLGPFEFGVPSLRKTRIDDQQYVMVTKAYELWEVEERWNQKVSADRNDKFGSFDERLTTILSAGSAQHTTPTGSSSKDKEVPMVVVKETWIKPGHLAPEGAVLVTAGDKILDLKPWPKWCNGKYPFYKVEYIKVSGSYYGKPMLNALIPIQRRHNRAVSIVVEQMNVLAQTRVAAPKNTQVKGILSGKGVLFETPMGATSGVTNISAPPIGDLPFLEMENTRAAIRDISHQHEVTKGHTPPNVRSGTAINALKELDDSASTMPIRSIERATQRMGQHILSIVKENWQEDRYIYVLGVEGDVERQSFVSGGDVGGQFIVQPGSAWPYSRAERQQMVFHNLEYGLITPEEALKYQDLGLPRNVLSQRNRDLRHVRRENQKFSAMSAVNPQTGQPDPAYLKSQFSELLPADWHNHAIHLEEHNAIRKSPSYERWPVWKKALFESHIAGHMAAYQAQLEAMQGMGQPPTQEEKRAEEAHRRDMEQSNAEEGKGT